MGKNNGERTRTLISLSLLTIGVFIIVLGAIRGFGIPIFQIIFKSPILETQANAIIGLGTALTFVAIWIQQKPFVRLKGALGF